MITYPNKGMAPKKAKEQNITKPFFKVCVQRFHDRKSITLVRDVNCEGVQRSVRKLQVKIKLISIITITIQLVYINSVILSEVEKTNKI